MKASTRLRGHWPRNLFRVCKDLPPTPGNRSNIHERSGSDQLYIEKDLVTKRQTRRDRTGAGGTRSSGRNRDYTGMWGRLGSTDLMAGKVMFLRSNQDGRLDGNESVADSFRSDLVGFKSWSATILGAFYSFFVCQKKPP
ncbi:hypothetical protein TNCV_2384231 [Trichonephila clavipes]|nr:hypothetical protein TNCV_2384231 [Trichonephila clavipes]